MKSVRRHLHGQRPGLDIRIVIFVLLSAVCFAPVTEALGIGSPILPDYLSAGQAVQNRAPVFVLPGHSPRPAGILNVEHPGPLTVPDVSAVKPPFPRLIQSVRVRFPASTFVESSIQVRASPSASSFE